MMWKYLEQNVSFTKDLNWVQHWVSRIGVLGCFEIVSVECLQSSCSIKLRHKLQVHLHYKINMAFVVLNRPFPSSSQPLFQGESMCKVFVMKISFHSY